MTDTTQDAPASVAEQVDALADGQWTKLDTGNGWGDVAVTRAEHDQMVANGSEPFWGWGGSKIVFQSWNSAAFDADENRMFFMGGGRTNYGGNEVYEFDFDTLQWSRVTDPSPLTVKDWDDPEVDGPSDKDVFIPEGAPNSAHTYDSLVWNPVTETFWYTATSIGFDDSNGDRIPRDPSVKAVWELDVETGVWTQHDATLNAIRGSSTFLPGSEQIITFHNESSHDVFAFTYDADGTETVLGKVRHPDGSALRLATDAFTNPETGESYVVTPGEGISRIEIQGDSVVAERVLKFPSVEELGTSFGFAQAGYAFRPEDGKFYIWNGGEKIVRWDPDSGDVELLWNEEAGVAPPATAAANGRTFQKWTYLEEQDAFTGVVDGEVFVWRPGDNPDDLNVAQVGEVNVDFQTTGSLGVFLPLLGGDKNQDSEVTVSFRESGTDAWQDASDLLRMRPELNNVSNPSPDGYAGSIFGLDPETQYDIRVEVTDPDGTTGPTTQTITASTAAETVAAPANANVIAVDSVAELRGALDNAQAGDVIELQPGTYAIDEVLSLNATGTADNPVVLRGADRETTIIDAQEGRGLAVGGEHVVVEDLTIENTREGIRVNGDNITIRQNEISVIDLANKAHKGIIGTADNLQVLDNVIKGPFPFGQINNAGGDRGIDVGGHNVEIAYNTVSGTLDAIAGGRDGSVGVEIHHNKVLWTTDNAIELDGGLRNLSAHDNLLLNSSDAISAQPVNGGPAYIFDNILHNVEGTPFKVKPTDASPQGLFIVNNTITKAGAAWINNSGTPTQVTVANNLFAAQGEPGNTVVRNGSDHRLLDMDNNAFLTDGSFRLDLADARDISVDSFAEWQAQTPFGDNSVLLDPDAPVFENLDLDFDVNDFFTFRSGDVDFSPDPNSAAVDAGRVFANINDDFKGAAPDIGAFEVGDEMPEFGARIAHKSPLAPTANADFAVTETGESVVIDVFANDTDANGGVLSVARFTDVENGDVVVNDDGTITFTPTAGFSGEERFSLTVTDNQDGEDTNDVVVSVVDGNLIAPSDEALLLQSAILTATLDNGARVAEWRDSAGNNDAHQADTAAQPTLLEVDGASGLHFDGRDDVLRIDNSDSLNVGGPYDAKTLSFAFRPGQDVDSRQVIYEQGGSGRGINVYLEDGQVHASAWNLAEEVWGPLTLSGDVSPGQVHKITLNMDATAGTFSAYLDGGSLGVEQGVDLLHDHGDPGAFGAMARTSVFRDGAAEANDTDFHFGGDIFDAAFYNRTLSDEERIQIESQLGAGAASLPLADSNEAPIAVDDTAATTAGTPLTIDILANDSDADGDALSLVELGESASGTLQANDDGSVTFTPDSEFVGEAGFTYTVGDGNGGQDTGRVTVNVEEATTAETDESGTTGGETDDGTNDVAEDDAAPDETDDGASGVTSAILSLNAGDVAETLSSGASVSLWSDGALGNDAFQEDAGRQPTLVTSDGVAALRFDGDDDILRLDNSDSLNVGGPFEAKTLSLAFRPGADVESRQVIYEQGGAAQGLNVYLENGEVHVSAWNSSGDAWGPLTLSGSVQAGEAHAVTLGLDAAAGTLTAYLDGESLGTLSGAGALASHGNPSALGGVVEHTLFGEEEITTNGTSFHFEGDILGAEFYNTVLTDNARDEVRASLMADVLANANAAPIAVDDTAVTTAGTPVTIDVLANDSDADGDALSLVELGESASGTLQANDDGSVTFTPDSEFVGEAGFAYTVGDGNGGQDTGRVTIDVTAPQLDPESLILSLNAGDVAETLSSGASVSLWSDGALGNDAFQEDAGRQPTLVTSDGVAALRFDGDDDILRLDNSDSLNVGGPFEAKTLSLAFRPGADVESRQVIYEQGGAAQGLNVYLENGEVHVSAWNSSGDAWGPLTLSGSVQAGEAHAVTLGLDAAAGTLTAYLDGESLGTLSGAGALASHGNPSALGGVVEHTLFGEEEITTNGTSFHFEGDILGAFSGNAPLSEDFEVQGVGPTLDSLGF